MATLSISNTFVADEDALASEVNTNFSDVSSYINARNNGSADWDFVSSAGLITAKALIRTNDGTVGAPAYSFTSDTNSGIHRSGADTIDIVAGGVVGFRVDSTQHSLIIDGTVALPGLAFIADENTGVFRSGGDTLNLVTGGVQALRLDSAQHALFTDGTALLPSISFSADPNSGFFRSGSDEISFVVGGATRFSLSASSNSIDMQNSAIIRSSDGSVSSPSYAWINQNNTGIYRASGADISFTTSATQRAQINDSGFFVIDGTALAPSISFLNDTNTGIFRSTGDTIDITAGGTTRGQFDNSVTADDTGFLLYDVTAGTLKRVSRGAVDSESVGFRTLRIPN